MFWIKTFKFSVFGKQEEVASRFSCRTWSKLAAEKNLVMVRLNNSLIGVTLKIQQEFSPRIMKK